MNIHSNARLLPCRREELVLSIIQGGHTPKEAAASFGVCERTARKWFARYRAEGLSELRDRSSRPFLSPSQAPPAQVATVLSLRKLRMPGFQIARQTGLSKATVSRILRRHKLHRLSLLDPPPPVRRYERLYPGELIHTDIKKLARIERVGYRITGNRQRDHVRGVGWEFVHVAIDDTSRIAFAKITGKGQAKNTQVTTNAIIKSFKKWIGHQYYEEVRKIRPSQLDEWLANEEPRLRNTTYNRYAGFLKQLFELAAKDRIIPEAAPANSLVQLGS